MNGNVSGSITPNDWNQICDLLEGKLKPQDICQVRSYDSSFRDTDYNDTNYAAIGYQYRSNPGQTWFAVHAGNDTSGWGCMGDYARVTFHSTFEETVRNGLTKESRRWLGLSLEGEE